MSKKQLNSRLNDLFTSFADQVEIAPVQTSAPVLAGWTWSANRQGQYTACSVEVQDLLGCAAETLIGQALESFRMESKSSAQVQALLLSGEYPAEADVLMHGTNNQWVPVRICVLSGPNQEGDGWHGLSQLIPQAGPSYIVPNNHKEIRNDLPHKKVALSPEIQKAGEPTQSTGLSTPKDGIGLPKLAGVAVSQNGIQPVNMPWTNAGRASLKDQLVKVIPSQPDHPATIAVPFQANEMGDLLLEVVDEGDTRTWSEEERQMVVEVASQLSLALENARLFQAAQQELTERERAEAIILHRNRDLAMLNKIGQRLTSLTSRNEIFDTLAEMVGQVLDNQNLYICMFDRARQNLSFPVYRENGLPKNQPDRVAANGLPEYLVENHKPLLITNGCSTKLEELGIDKPDPMPASLLGIPIQAGTHQVGALVVVDFVHEDAHQFDEVHLELLSTAASQAATALENASLFQQMQNALKAIENRERYQAGVARSAASLSEFGTQSLGDVLRFLGQASQANRVYFMTFQEEEIAWRLVEDWTSPFVAYLFDRGKIQSVGQDKIRPLMENLRKDGWSLPFSVNPDDNAEAFFKSQNVQSALVLSVAGKGTAPNLLIFEQIDHPRQWHQDEINILRVAADAIANTYVREDLLSQLRANLDETESLYNASNRLVIANDFQEMLAAVINGVKPGGINRSLMLLFETDAFNKVTRLTVQANWYSGHGTPPHAVGVEMPRAIYERPMKSINQAFFEDIKDALMDENLRQELLRQNVISLAVLPMWSGKRQIGVLLIECEQPHNFSHREKRLFPPLVDQLTISVENMRLFEQTQTALSETALLYNVSSGIAQAQTMDDMIALVVNHVLPRGADRASLIITNLDENNEMTDAEIAGYIDTTGESNLKGMHMKIEEFPLLRILPDDGLAISDLNDTTLDNNSLTMLERNHVRAACFVPLRTGGRTIGALVASSRKPTEFEPADISLFRTVANGIAVAVEKQRLLRQAQRRALELQTASEIARDTTSTLTQDVLLSRMVSLLVERFNFYHASIFLVDDKGQFATINEASGLAGEELKKRGYRVAVGSRSIVGTVTASGLPLILNDVSTSDLYYPNPLLPETRSEIGLPLKLGDKVIGALDIQSNTTNTFGKDDTFVFGILADQIAIAIENARAYEISQQAIEDMIEVDRVKSQFLANMSHELRTPLNSIIGFSRVILKGIDGPINDVQNQDLSAIYNSGQHLLSLINDILDLSKIDAGKMELSFSDVNLSDLINSAMSTAVGLVKDKPIKLTTSLPENLPIVRADSIRVRQVLINFLSNAAKFTDEGTISIEAKLVTSDEGVAEIMVTVTDSGPGIAESDQDKLFLPFSQVDDSPTRKTGGTGLGLSICRSLIDMHKGRIGLLHSEIGKGSTFFFTLQLPEAEVEQLDIVPGKGNVILAVDDDPQVINLYERYLHPQGYEVIPHTNPCSAVETAKKIKPFAITLDIMMPEMDGWQVMKALKDDPATREIPIVVCSILEEEEKGFNLGAADYLVKPFLSEDLLNALNRLNIDGELHEILVVDDDPEDLRLVQKMIEENKRFQAVLAKGGKAGWEVLQQKIPDAIILDLFMPEMNGFELLANIRANPVFNNIPVIILTGADLTPDQHQQLTDSGQHLLSKGFLREKELLNALDVALRQIKLPNRKAA